MAYLDVLVQQYKSKYQECQKNDTEVPQLTLRQLELTKVPSSVLQFSLLKSLVLDYNDVSSLTTNFCCCLTNLSYLSLQGNSLLDLPNNFGHLRSLTELLLNENSIEKLPESFVQLCNLQELQLVGNALQELPCSFGKLRNLKKLMLDENALEFFPDSIGDLKNLVTLDARYNRLQKLPSGFGHLESLAFLDLSNNKLTELSSSFGELLNLQVLDLSFNKITVLPSKCRFSSKIGKLFLEENELTDLPSWFSELVNVVELSVKNNLIRGCPFAPHFGKALVKLKHFDFSGNYIDILPETFGDLCSLEFMDMGSTLEELERRRSLHNGNFLVRLPDSFGSLFNLRELHLDENELEALPDSFGNLRNLEFVDLCHNRLNSIPESFCCLKSLKICHLSINCLTSIPKNFGNLTQLEDLRLDNNMLRDLPETFGQLTNLETLDLYMNCLENIPPCLTFLTKLKRLDLLENNLGIPVLEVPNILVKSTYAPRNPDLIDNWRGKKRADILDLTYTQLSSTVNGNGDLEIDNGSLKRIQQALRSGSSIRKKHSDVLDIVADVEKDAADTIEDEMYSDDLEELCSTDTTDLGSSTLLSSEQKEESDIEYWDADIADENPYGFGWNHAHRKPSTVKVGEHTFVPSDIHMPPVQVRNYLWPVSEGQFDDVD